jgi:hypothetical protein
MDEAGGRTMKLMSCMMMLIVTLVISRAVPAQTLEYAGVLGNSGVAGPTLVRVNTTLKKQDGSGLNSGAYVGPDARVWLSGGDAINCLSFDGKLIKRFPLTPSKSRVNSTAFAALDGVLYTFGHTGKPDPKSRSDVMLFALPMNDSSASAKPVAGFEEYKSWRGGILCSTPRDGKLLYAYAIEAAKGEQPRIVIGTLDPRDRSKNVLLELPGVTASGLAIDPDGQSFYLGGDFGKFVGGQFHPNVSEIVKLTWAGKELWRRGCLDTPAEPTRFRGIVSIAGDAIWDPAWYGFLARFDRTGKTAPGKITSWDMRIPFVTQVVDVRRSMELLAPRGVSESLDPLLMSMNSPDQAYLATWDDESKSLTLQTRLGALPNLENVALSDEGWVNAGGFWWKFDDAANAAPIFANHSAAVSPGAWRGDWISSIALGDKATPVTGRPAFGRASAQSAHEMPAPFKKVRGFAVDGSKPLADPFAYASDGVNKLIWRTTMEPRLWAPRKEWKSLMTESITEPGDIAVLDDGSLVVVDGSSIVRVNVRGDGLSERSRLSRWGDGPHHSFGAKLRLAADAGRILVSDTDRHRVVLIDVTTFKPIAEFGTIDRAGVGEQEFTSPGSVAIAGDRAVVADQGNQRIVKLRIVR